MKQVDFSEASFSFRDFYKIYQRYVMLPMRNLKLNARIRQLLTAQCHSTKNKFAFDNFVQFLIK